jgi:hypothetical protein
MSDQVADPAGGKNGGLTPEFDPAISPGGHVPLSSGADVTAPGLLTAPESAAPTAPEASVLPPAASPAVASLEPPNALGSAPGEVARPSVPGQVGSLPLPGQVGSLPLPGAVGAPPPLPATSARPARRRRAGRVIALVVLIVVAVAGIGVGGTLLTRELTRGPTSAEKTDAVQREIASRWQRYPAGKIFTPTLAYSTTDWGANFKATLLGIAPAASCAVALDPAMAAFLVKYGCVTVLRATYLDYSGTQAVTIGVVVMRTVSGAGDAATHPVPLAASAGLRTFPLPGTVAAEFGDAQRRYFSILNDIYNYVFLSVAGYTDGRVSGSASSTPSLEDLGSGVVTSVESVLTYAGSACTMKEIRC